ncbi:MAG: phosphate ABC transporter substrate-binding protein PstS [Thermodesulfobacteriota bacterium]|nr:MAG: phosphate ABC transporter substrate-binding protein PstS [Thermodesulfobacteriota bacterium]
MKKILLLALIFLGLSVGTASAQLINGAGATFPYPLYSKWAYEYNRATGVRLNYQSIGSGGGIRQVTAGTVDFGASDAPLGAKELGDAGLVQFPMAVGGVVPVVNLEGVSPGSLQLTGEVLADIFLGKITKWNDQRIAALNPGVKLPDTKITVVHRSDGSGTTWIFANYLSKVSPEWKGKVGFGTAVNWPAGVGGKGNEGVAMYVKRMKNSIGYVEYAYAIQNKLTHAKLSNKAGSFVEPSMETFQSAAANADWKGTPGFGVVLTDQSGKDSWPIAGATFILVKKNQSDCKKATEVLKFFGWAYRNGAEMAKSLDYVPIPPAVYGLMEAAWARDIKCNSQPVWGK